MEMTGIALCGRDLCQCTLDGLAHRNVQRQRLRGQAGDAVIQAHRCLARLHRHDDGVRLRQLGFGVDQLAAQQAQLTAGIAHRCTDGGANVSQLVGWVELGVTVFAPCFFRKHVSFKRAFVEWEKTQLFQLCRVHTAGAQQLIEFSQGYEVVVHGSLSVVVSSGQLSAAAKALTPMTMQKAARQARAVGMVLVLNGVGTADRVGGCAQALADLFR